jgi:hypothetical protein
METYAVLTGDIVKSREIAARSQLIEVLKEALEAAKEQHHAEYDLYRGDSFQVVVPSAPAAALVAMVIRAKLKSHSPKGSEPWDVRISIGVGEITYRGAKITESDGPAFLLSGQGMEELNKKNRRLIVKAPWEEADRSLSLVTRFADDIVSNWSRYSAETAFYGLVYNESQSVLAKRLGKSQSTIHDRIATAKLELVRAYIQHVKEHVHWHTQT